MIGNSKKSRQNYDWDDKTISYATSHMSMYNFDYNKNIIIKTKFIVVKKQIKNTTLLNHNNIAWFFFIKEFKILLF